MSQQPPRSRRRTAPSPTAPRRPSSRTLRLGSGSRRLTVSFVGVVVLVLVLGGRLVQLQALDGATYASAAQQSRLRTTDIQATRGQILDRNGEVMAYSVDADAVFADPSMIIEPFSVAQRVAPMLGVPVSTAQQAIVAASARGSRFVYLAHDVDPTIAEQVMALGIEGIGTLPEPERMHPDGSIGASVVGFTDRDGHGRAGIEQQFDKPLSGTPGRLTVEVGQGGEVIPSGVHKETAAVAGSTVRLTISSDLQYVAQQALNQAVRSTGARGGQVTVMDARTSRVLAMTSDPTYDASDPGASPGPLLSNPNVSDVFEPGSANKIITFAAALERHVITPRTVLNVPGELQVADRTIHDDWVHSPVRWTATGILAKSSNIGTLLIAQKLGPKAWDDYAKAFGEGSTTGIQLPTESAGLLPAMKDWSGSTFGNLPIGQGVAVTSLQLANMYQVIANDGVRVPARIVQSVTAPDGSVARATAPAGHRIVSVQTARTLQQMLQMVTQEGGTAPKAAIAGYTVAGKTGTGQQLNPDGTYSNSNYWSTFAGFAPADNPAYVISVMVDTPQTDYLGGDVAAPLFGQIMTYALKAGGVPPTGARPASLPLYP
ncbi:MAG: peptidoglycan D,D-transpeptidase FtsI family protein [Mycobacteriales bacterium]|nr:MAG: penicillin-binding protein 2 [Pseudonocardiales bacterium]